MTQEEKAKRYDEALEVCKKLYNEAKANEYTSDMEDYESIFPELKESEDERIRKALIKETKGSEERLFETVTNDEFVAWLERQAQKPADTVEQKKLKKTKFKTGDRIIGIVSGMQYYITEVCDDYYNTESGCTIMFCAQENFELYKQKPVWSEKDEKMLDLTLFYLDRYVKMKDVSKCETWLNSLRFQKQWKPSDEQIIALRWVLNNIPYNKHKEEISGLLDQIKEL